MKSLSEASRNAEPTRAQVLKQEMSILKEMSKPGTRAKGASKPSTRSQRPASLPNLDQPQQSQRGSESIKGDDPHRLPSVQRSGAQPPNASTARTRQQTAQNPAPFVELKQPEYVQPSKLWEKSLKEQEHAEQEQLKEAMNFRKANAKQQRRLLKLLRHRMHTRFKDTAFLPTNLWKSYRECDLNANGRIEFDEFSIICDRIGLGNRPFCLCLVPTEH